MTETMLTDRAETVFTTNMTTTHEHECRDCGEGYDCDGIDHWNGCELFDGSCPDCHALERLALLTRGGGATVKPLTASMERALRLAANEHGEITAVRSADWRYGNEIATRTAWALEKRGLIERRWTGTDRFGSACYVITARGRNLAATLLGPDPDEDDE